MESLSVCLPDAEILEALLAVATLGFMFGHWAGQLWSRKRNKKDEDDNDNNGNVRKPTFKKYNGWLPLL